TAANTGEVRAHSSAAVITDVFMMIPLKGSRPNAHRLFNIVTVEGLDPSPPLSVEDDFRGVAGQAAGAGANSTTPL
ncbi:hypothetical protein ACVXHB_28875, partial [Escherichia coli]